MDEPPKITQNIPIGHGGALYIWKLMPGTVDHSKRPNRANLRTPEGYTKSSRITRPTGKYSVDSLPDAKGRG